MRDLIADMAWYMAGVEQAMRDGIGLFDMEEDRVMLSWARALEKVLTAQLTETDGKA